MITCAKQDLGAKHSMRLKVLGSAAGGGFPQWNCNYYLSIAARNNDPHIKPRTQSSLAASASEGRWVIFNASPDIRTQIIENKELHPNDDGLSRNSPISAVVLTNADVDHIAGLLSLREKQPFVIYATKRVLDVLDNNSIFNVLDKEIVQRRKLELGEETELTDAKNQPLGLMIEAFAVPGKIALFLEDQTQSANGFGTATGDTIGIKITSQKSGESAYYIPGCATVDDNLAIRLKSAKLLMFDGTVFDDDEMLNAGVGVKTGARMGHMAISGPSGSIEALKVLNIDRKIYLHINNTNPILDEKSAQAAFVRANGWEIAYDGMEITS